MVKNKTGVFDKDFFKELEKYDLRREKLQSSIQSGLEELGIL